MTAVTDQDGGDAKPAFFKAAADGDKITLTFSGEALAEGDRITLATSTGKGLDVVADGNNECATTDNIIVLDADKEGHMANS